MTLSGLSALLCLFLMSQIIPTRKMAAQAELASTKNTTVDILSINLLSTNSDFAEVNTLIEITAPDVLVLIELTSLWEEHIDVHKYPYHIKSPREDHFGIGLYSKFPLELSQIVDFTNSRFPFIHAGLSVNEKLVNILAVHFENPVGGRASHIRNFQMTESADFLNTLSGPKLVIGDFNCSPYSHAFKSLLDHADLYDSRSKFMIGNSWPSFFYPLMIPIDHALVSKDIQIIDRSLNTLQGSDHKSLFVRLALE